MTAAQCPDCDLPMEIGYVPENLGSGTVVQMLWQSSTPQQSLAFGVIRTGGIKPSDGQEPIPIWVFRCPNCGLLRLHAIALTDQPPV